MTTKRKYKRRAHHFDGFDFSQVMQFMKDNPELVQMAGSMLGGQQQAQSQPASVDRGMTGQKQVWSGDKMVPLSNEVAGLANAINSVTDRGNIPVEEAMNLPRNYYDDGGWMGYATTSINGVANAFNSWNGIDTTQYTNKVRNYGNQQVAASDNQELLNAWANKNYLTHVNKYDITGGNLAGEILGRFNQNVTGAGAGFLSTGNWIGAVIGGVTDLAGQGLNIFNTARKVKNLNREIDVANARLDASYDNAASNIKKKQQTNIMANYSAYGGPLYGMPIMGATSYDIAKDNAYAKQMQVQSKNSTSFTPIFNAPAEYAEGGSIHIAPSKRGTFTAAAKKHGKSVQAFASQVLAHPENYSPAMRKKANFARNASKWHHADGGFLISDDFTNGVTMIDQGGTHENNPHEGVQMGIAPDGKPNLVEEGEAIFNDYVFSNRLRVPKEVRNKYKLRGPKDMTFAEAFREVQKESQERPNDPISQDGLNNMAMVLARTQEAVRAYERGHKKAKGGHLFGKGYPPYDSGSMTPQEFYRIYGTLPVVDIPADNMTPEEGARITGNVASVEQDIVPTDIKSEENTVTNGSTNNKNGKSNLSWLRYAEPFANAAAVFSDMIGMTNTPTQFDYIPGFQAVSYNPLGNYIPVTHFDTRYAANRAAQQAAATRNAIMQSSAPGRNAALLAADYNAQIANGELLRQAAMDDYNMMVKREEFNRATNQANSQMGLKAAMANQEARLKYGQAALQQAKMNDDAANIASAARAQNLSTLAENIANIGRESDARQQANWLIDSDAYGTLNEAGIKLRYNNKKEREDYARAHGWTEDQIKAAHFECGGKIRKRKKGLTY